MPPFYRPHYVSALSVCLPSVTYEKMVQIETNIVAYTLLVERITDGIF